jgi:hypothetical protein
MALRNRAKMTISSVAGGGTGTLTLGSAVAGYQTFAAANVANAEVVTYCIEETGGLWELGTGTYTSSETTLSLSRSSVIASSSGTSLVTFTTAATVYVTASAADLVSPGTATTFTAAQTFPNTGLKVKDGDGSHSLIISAGGNLTADRTLTLTTGDASRTIDISAGSVTITAFGGTLVDDADNTAARTTLGLGSIATQAANSVSITGGSITGITDLAVADGGTGASTAADARTNLGAAASGANTDLSSVYLNNTGLKIKDTNATHGLTIAPGSNLTADRILTITTGDVDRAVTLSGDLTVGGTSSINGTAYVVNGTDVAVADGGTGASTAADARTNLGLGSIATQASSSVTITGGSISGITDLAVADGGTGASNASDARTNLGAAASGSNTDLTSVYLNNTGLKIKDTNATHGLIIAPGSNLTADRTLNITTGDADRTVTLSGDLTVGAASSISGTAYVSGGTDVTLADGGTGASLADPNADRIMFWDDSAGAVTWLAPNDYNVKIDTTTLYVEETWMVAASDETTALTTGTAKASFVFPYDVTVISVGASVNTAGTGLTVDINENGAANSILSTKITLDSGEKTSLTASVPPLIGGAGPAITAGNEITIDIDSVSGTAKGLKVWMIVRRTS